jgi:NitT/TauT family transport system substrate-binding protein
MKKIWIILLLVFLTGCSSTEKIKMMVPYGSPQLSQLYLQDNQDHYDVDIVVGADPLVAAFGSNSHDVIFAPINLGAKMFNSKEDYVLLGVVTWGNYYLISSTEINGFSSLNQKNLIIFGRNQVSDILIQYLIREYQIEVAITYVDSLSTATAHAIVNPYDIVMVAEPSYSLLKKENIFLYSIDLQQAFKEVSLDDSFPQAGVFIHQTVNAEKRLSIQVDLINSINQMNQDANKTAELAVRLGIDLDLDVLKNSFLSSNIEFRSATESKSAIILFFNLIMEINPGLIGNKLPNDTFYVE